ncbi:ABC transporter permease [Fodinisporobacter ferrooxydans]|uniref:Molybdenum transport system permease n=1 Tax=Fodinisporobacter ferrooxydans TaxID=2901836 RepID=A0ABY4CES4_9BACL|nr:ABC transporter permease [Alicyclobacillaceae bacterium MYW30-H2]
MNLRGHLGRMILALLIALGLAFLFMPLLSVFVSMSPGQLLIDLNTAASYQALQLSMETTVVTLFLTVLLGTPIAYWLSKSQFRGRNLLRVAVQMPIVSPPAVAGVGLLLVFGRMGLLGHTLTILGLSLSFNTAAVVLAQVFISIPFYISAGMQAFEAINDQLVAVSRTLGVSKWNTFCRVTLPIASPGLLSGVALSWGRALGEFGATMMFAGNLPGKTQTLPLAIYTAMQSNMNAAIAMSALLLIVSFVLLLSVFLIGRTQQSNRIMRKEVRQNDAVLQIKKTVA